MHYIQKKIIDKLIYTEGLAYSKLKPKEIESNLFAYHLKQLIKDDLIEKVGKEYRLSTNGKAYIDTVSYKTLEHRHQPKITTMLDVTNAKGETILYKRKNQPYIGMVSFPTGKAHLGETLTEAAHREAEDKLGIKDIELMHRGVVYIGISENDIMVSQIMAHVFQGEYDKPLPDIENVRATSFWGDPKEVNEKEDFIPGFFEIKQLLSQEGLFFEEYLFTL